LKYFFKSVVEILPQARRHTQKYIQELNLMGGEKRIPDAFSEFKPFWIKDLR
jgi:hypothetical protein